MYERMHIGLMSSAFYHVWFPARNERRTPNEPDVSGINVANLRISSFFFLSVEMKSNWAKCCSKI